MIRRHNNQAVHGVIFALLSPWLALAGDFDLQERRLLAGIREYHSGVVDSIFVLATQPEAPGVAAQDPAAAIDEPSLEPGVRAALRELAAYPGLLSIVGDSTEQLAKLSSLRVRTGGRVFEALERLRADYDVHTRAAAGAWQRLLDQDTAALGEYRSLLNEYCEAQRQRFVDFPYVVVKSRAYYLACPPDESLLAFAAQRGVGDSLGRAFDRWAADFSPAAIDQAILENGENVRAPRAEDLLAYLPASRRADMWAMPGSNESELIGLMPVIMQPAGDQPEEARRAKLAAETARLWSPPGVLERDLREEDRRGDGEPPLARAPGEADDRMSALNAPEIADDVPASAYDDDERDISSLQSNPWTPYTELSSDYDDRGYVADSRARSYGGYYDDGWYGGTYIDVGPTIYYGRHRYYNSYSCGVPTYYGCAPIAACPPVVIWRDDSPLFCRERSRGGISISIGGSDRDRWRGQDHSGYFPERRWNGGGSAYGQGRDSSERAHIESSGDSLRRRPSSVTQTPVRPREPNAGERIRSARENLNERLNELRDRAGRNSREIGRRAGANAPAGRPAVNPQNGGTTIRRGTAAPAGSPAVQPGGSPRRIGPSAPAGQPAVRRGSAVRSSGPTTHSEPPRATRPPIQRTPRTVQPGQKP
ncbi:MAG: hypothetical protein JNG88_08940 [Phycisphaerales bacterium]|nr:hypothetical protein [Phycisphaerales bacterium]